MSTHRIQTQIEINASAEQVWTVLVDFAAYPAWNPFIRAAVGVPERGARIEIAVQPNGGNIMHFSPVVLSARAGRELRWRGQLPLPGIFAGEHCFIIEPMDERTVRFQHSERFSGILVGLLRASLDRDTQRGFEDMNRALKLRVEQSRSDLAR
jgi:hypothetical protein